MKPNKKKRETLIKEFTKELKKPIPDLKNIEQKINETLKIKKNYKKPQIIIEETAILKMRELVKQSDVEIQWHGLVKREKNKYRIYDIIVFPQLNSGARTETDEEEFAEWFTRLMMNNEELVQDIKMHGHSHVNMQVFSSDIDDEYQKKIIQNLKEDAFYIFLILNKKDEIHPIIYDIEKNLCYTGNEIEIIVNENKEYKEWAKEEIKGKCKKKYYTSQKWKGAVNTYEFE